MDKDAREELERLERELLAEDGDDIELTDDELLDLELEQLLGGNEPEPAFDDPQTIHEPKEPLVYCNYSNDYGRDLEEFAETGGDEPKKTIGDGLTIGLMIGASVLCLGIIGVMIYWLENYL